VSNTIIIVGAGIAGLTLAKKLAAQGIDTIMIEREDSVGGLARSFRYDNGAIFDIGPHRFHTDDEKVRHFIEETLYDNLMTIPRDSQLFIFDRYVPWPVTLKSVLALPPVMLLRMGFDLLLPRKAANESFESYIIERYGRTLYDVFFKPYTEKFLNYKCANLHRDWASAGINRATIDKQVNTASLAKLVGSVLFSKGAETKFLYPREGGIGAFTDKLAADVVNLGGRILLSSQVSRFVTKGSRICKVVTESGEEAPGGVPRMSYISTMIFNYLVADRVDRDFQWCYFGEKIMEMNRVAMPRNFNPGLVPPSKDALCIEVVNSGQTEVWKDPTRLDCVIETFLLRTGLIKSLDCIVEYHVEKIRETYPMYTLNYPRKLRSVFRWIEETWDNLTLLGRTGRFWYNNMDHSIAASLNVAEKLLEDYEKGLLRKGSAYSAEDRCLGDKAQ